MTVKTKSQARTMQSPAVEAQASQYARSLSEAELKAFSPSKKRMRT